LAIGVGEDVRNPDDAAGAVHLFYGSSSGLSATSPKSDQFWTQDSSDVNDASEPGDGFGETLASGDFNGDGRDDLAIAAPSESVHTATGFISFAGAVNVLYCSSRGLSATSPTAERFWA